MTRAELFDVIEQIERESKAQADLQARLWRIANDECEPGDYDPEQHAEPGSVKAYERAEDCALEGTSDWHLERLLAAVHDYLASN